jgi:DMSO/TMAO reductase YedYZ molybdopterin-dependent catalytic subunit
MKHFRSTGCVLIACVLAARLNAQDSATHVQANAATASISVAVGGDVPQPYTITAATLASMPRRTVKAGAPDHGLPDASYEGVALTDILARAGAPLGSALRGPAMATYVIVSAADNYRVVFALPELDSAFTDRVVILADHKDGQPLGARDGPVRLIVPGEKRPARWEREVTAITVRHATD